MIRPRFNRGSVQTIGRGGTTFILADDPSLTLDLQFANDRAFTARLGPLPTFTRASTGTFVGSNGLIQTAAINTARIDFSPSSGACLGLLVEESRTNLTLWSEDATNATWTKVNVTTTGNTTAAPDGNSSADTITETAVSGQHYTNQQSVSVTSGTTYTYSVFLKKGSGATAPDWVCLLMFTGAFGTKNIAINLATGATGASAGGLTATVQQYPNGWWRVSVSAAAIATNTFGGVYVSFTNNVNTASAPTYTGQTTSNVFVWGAQFEAGSFASSYIPTTSAAVVRSADVCSITGAAFTGFYNASEGTIVCKLRKGYQITAAISQLNYLTFRDAATSYLQLAQRGSGVSGEVFRCEDAGTSQSLTSMGAAVAENTLFGMSYSYKLNDFRGSLNGATPASDTTGTVPATIDRFEFVTFLSANRIHSIQYFNAIKTNAQLQALSTP